MFINDLLLADYIMADTTTMDSLDHLINQERNTSKKGGIGRFLSKVADYTPVIGSLRVKEKAVKRTLDVVKKVAEDGTISGTQLWEVMRTSGVNNGATRKQVMSLVQENYTINGAVESAHLVRDNKVVNFLNEGLGLKHIGDGLQVYKTGDKWDTFKANTHIGGETRAIMSGTLLAAGGSALFYGLSGGAQALDDKLQETGISEMGYAGLAISTVLGATMITSLDGYAMARGAQIIGNSALGTAASKLKNEKLSRAAYVSGLAGTATILAATGCSFDVRYPGFSDGYSETDTGNDSENPDITFADLNCDDQAVYQADFDGDGFSDPNDEKPFCSEEEAFSEGYIVPTEKADCNDLDNFTYPNAPEMCDGLDNDCDDVVDNEIVYQTWFLDSDGDGFGDSANSKEDCVQPDSGKNYVLNNLDCDDSNPNVNPLEKEVCNGIDDNCKNGVDEQLPLIDYCPDVDGDGDGDPSLIDSYCKNPSTEELNFVQQCGDCNVLNSQVSSLIQYDGCDGVDNDCDNAIDEDNPPLEYFLDADSDGHGAGEGTISCTPMPGYVAGVNDDCNDSVTSIHPDAKEVCNLVDDNCNGEINEGLPIKTCYEDQDQDGFGSVTLIDTCETMCPAYTTTTPGDCNDSIGAINPLAPEMCDLVDNNCNNQVDEGLEDMVACDVFNDNLNGTETVNCVDGSMVTVASCVDPDECSAGYSTQVQCSNNVGECSVGVETKLCEDVLGTYMLVAQGDCNGTMPSSEDLNGNGVCDVLDLDGIDNNCDGVVDDVCMVTVPFGPFNMGCNDQYNPGCFVDNVGHEVLLDAYNIDQFEVTNDQYAQCVAAGVCNLPNSLASNNNPDYYGNPDFANHPVLNVDWNQAESFCEWAGKNLPTEAQWEKAARGVDGWPTFPWGYLSPTCDDLNYNMCVGDTTEVGSYPDGSSPYGAMDMSGNVMEWVADWYANYTGGAEENPTGPTEGTHKVVRGGMWAYPKDKVDVYVRRLETIDTSNIGIGFRCVKNNE